jgi:hypothetical protein
MSNEPTVAFGAFDAEHVELAFDVAEDEIGAGHATSLLRVGGHGQGRQADRYWGVVSIMTHPAPRCLPSARYRCRIHSMPARAASSSQSPM